MVGSLTSFLIPGSLWEALSSLPQRLYLLAPHWGDQATPPADSPTFSVYVCVQVHLHMYVCEGQS